MFTVPCPAMPSRLIMEQSFSSFRLSRVKKFQVCLWFVAFFVLVSMEKDIFLLSSESVEDTSVKIKNQTTALRSPKSAPISPPTPTPTTHPTGRPTRPTSKTRQTFPPEVPILPFPFNFTIHTPAEQFYGKSVDQLPPQTQSFLEEHCDLQGHLWYPGGTDAWNIRAPYVIVAGVWNGGIEPLSQALQLHPQVRKRVGVKDFFLPRTFYKFHTADTVKVFAARQRMYAQVFPKMTQSLLDPYNVAIDVSPGYLFYASQTSIGIQCVSPWAKVVILLRDPVERVYHQWVYGTQKLGLRLSLEEWMAQEIKAMQSVGLVSTNQSQPKLSQEEERKAWKDYQSKRNLAGAIGRSMYVLQLEEWFETLIAAGKQPQQEVFLLHSELWESQPYQQYQQLVEFLGLAPFTPSLLEPEIAFNSSNLPPMKTETRQLLHDFFSPYNRRLAALLKKHGFNRDDHWKSPIWR